MTKIILASTAAILTVLSFASVSEAGWRHRNHFGHFSVVIDTPRYVVDDYGYEDAECYVKKIRRYNRFGDLVVKKVQVCD
ncbi:MAG: hypothetical protein KDJ87_14435 [Rhizobiaceae bacterium]|nr:hypothetical protein [Rhizobiaceae bacterium]